MAEKSNTEIDIDDFLNLNNDFFPAAEETIGRPKSEYYKEHEKVAKVDLLKEIEDGLPKLCGDGYSNEFLAMIERVYSTYRILPKLNYPELYRELADLSITSSPTPTLQVLNDEIEKVQAAKDRLSEIMVKVLECHNIKKRLVDTIITAWGKFSSEKNAEGRKGDAIFRFSNFSIDLAKVESLLKVSSHILKNLDSLHDSLSRRITINQLLLKMNDMGRGSLPEYSFKKHDMNVNETDLFGKNNNMDSSKSLEAEEGSWD